jgi:hypothetical protein
VSRSTHPALSIVIEWENSRNSKKARAAEMLRRLFGQLRAVDDRFATRPEVILVYDAWDTSAARILAEVGAGQTRTTTAQTISFRIEATVHKPDDGQYYRSEDCPKNEGDLMLSTPCKRVH